MLKKRKASAQEVEMANHGEIAQWRATLDEVRDFEESLADQSRTARVQPHDGLWREIFSDFTEIRGSETHFCIKTGCVSCLVRFLTNRPSFEQASLDITLRRRQDPVLTYAKGWSDHTPIKFTMEVPQRTRRRRIQEGMARHMQFVQLCQELAPWARDIPLAEDPEVAVKAADDLFYDIVSVARERMQHSAHPARTIRTIRLATKAVFDQNFHAYQKLRKADELFRRLVAYVDGRLVLVDARGMDKFFAEATAEEKASHKCWWQRTQKPGEQVDGPKGICIAEKTRLLEKKYWWLSEKGGKL